MSNILKALTGAESEVQRLERKVVEWTAEAESKRAELAALESRSGAAVTAEDPAAAVRELAVQQQELRIWIDGARGAAQAAQEQLVVARWDLDEARAAELRDKAAKMTAAADAHDAEIEALLVQLRKLDGADYELVDPAVAAQEAIRFGAQRVDYDHPVSLQLRLPIQPLLDEAAALEARVSTERQAALRAVSPVTPRADVTVPEWDDVDSTSTVGCAVSEGVGSVTFEVITSGQYGGREFVTLPDESGGRHWSRRLKLQAGGGGAEVRVDGKVLARQVRPGVLMTDGGSRWWVDYDRCPGCRQLAPVTKRGTSPTQNRADGPVEEIACQNGCVGGKRLQAA